MSGCRHLLNNHLLQFIAVDRAGRISLKLARGTIPEGRIQTWTQLPTSYKREGHQVPNSRAVVVVKKGRQKHITQNLRVVATIFVNNSKAAASGKADYTTILPIIFEKFHCRGEIRC